MSGRLPVVLGISPLGIKNLLESNPPKSRFIIRELTVSGDSFARPGLALTPKDREDLDFKAGQTDTS